MDKALTLPWTGRNDMTSYFLNKTSAYIAGRYQLDWIVVLDVKSIVDFPPFYPEAQ